MQGFSMQTFSSHSPKRVVTLISRNRGPLKTDHPMRRSRLMGSSNKVFFRPP